MLRKSFYALVGLALLFTGCIPDGDGWDYASQPHYNEKAYTEFTTAQTVPLARIPAGRTIVANITDAFHDDHGAGGNVNYPEHWGFGAVGVGNAQHLLDINNVVISIDSTNIYFDIAMANICMPNQWEDPDDADLVTFDHVLLGMYLYKDGEAGTVDHLVTYAPQDGNGDGFNASNPSGKYGFNIAAGQKWKYSIQLIGKGGMVCEGISTSPSLSGFTKLNDTKAQLWDNNPKQTGVEGALFYSSIIRVTVPRKSTGGTEWLTAGDWNIVMVTWDWDDYAQDESVPGVNGFPRSLQENPDNIWMFRGLDVSAGWPKVMDIVAAKGIDDNQAAFLNSTTCTLTNGSYATFTVP